MSTSNLITAIILLLTALYVRQSECADCECDMTYANQSSPICSTLLLPPTPVSLCDDLPDNLNTTNITAFCANGCLDLYRECLNDSVNENCTNKLDSYPSSLCETNSGSSCWTLFAKGVEEMYINCTANADPCAGVLSSDPEACNANDCIDNLNMTSEELGCCAAELFNSMPFNARPSTNLNVYNVCDVNLTAACTEPPSTEPPSTEPPSTEPSSTGPSSTEPSSTESPSLQATASPTPTSAAMGAHSFINTAVLATLVLVGTYIYM